MCSFFLYIKNFFGNHGQVAIYTLIFHLLKNNFVIWKFLRDSI